MMLLHLMEEMLETLPEIDTIVNNRPLIETKLR
jgi:hypothetical protein